MRSSLYQRVLQPLRDTLGSTSVFLNSVYRSPELNAHPEIRGSSNSQHCKGMAADIQCHSAQDVLGLARTVVANNIPFDQMILEHLFSSMQSHWLHISYDPTKREQRREMKTSGYNDEGILKYKKFEFANDLPLPKTYAPSLYGFYTLTKGHSGA